MNNSIRQQNAERRLRHCRWEDERRAKPRLLTIVIVLATIAIIVVLR
jgi:hypothetical protein